MGWKIIFAPQAREELEQIVRFIAQDYIYYRIRRKEQVIEIMDYWHSARRDPRI